MRRPLLVLFVLIAGCGADAALEWSIEFEDEALADETVRVRGMIRLGGCDGAQVFVSEATRSMGSIDTPPVLAAGDYGFEAVALSDDCRPVGRGCADVSLPLGAPRVTTTIMPDSQPAECAPSSCLRGRCGDLGDAGSPDTGDADAGPSDADRGDTDACGGACDPCEVCVGGTCAPLECAEGSTCWDGVCCSGCVRDGECRPGVDPEACGAPGTECAVCGCDDACVSGRCMPNHVVSEVAIAATGSGDVSTCAAVDGRGAPGQVYCWGASANGRLGTATSGPALRPVRIEGLDGVVELAAGLDFTLALGGGGAVGFGSNSHQQIGVDGAPRDYFEPTPSFVDRRPVAIRAHEMGRVSCVIDFDNTLYCAGENRDGEVRTPTFGPVGPTRILGPSGGSEWLDVAGGRHHTCGVLRDRRLACWGSDDFGQLGSRSAEGTEQPPRFVDGAGEWKRVFAGFRHTCGISETDELFCWGDNDRGQIGTEAPDDASTPTPVAVSGPWRLADGGYRHSCAIRGTSLYCWGGNDFGQLGVDTPTSTQRVPIEVPGQWIALDLGGASTCAIDSFGGLYCWGKNTSGELGVGDTENRRQPTRVCFDR